MTTAGRTYPWSRAAGWVFDMDGTLTVAAHDFDGMRRTLGISPGQDILGAIEAMPPEAAMEAHRVVDRWERAVAQKSVLAPGADALLDYLAGCQRRLGVLTRNTNHTAWTTLDVVGLSARFGRDDVLGRDDAEAKPSPAGVQKLARQWGMTPRDLVVVGDHVADVQAGRAAGSKTVLVKDNPPASWRQSADLVLSSLQELWQLVEGA